MKKRIFTLMTAALLMAGPAFNAAYAGAVTPVAYSSVAGNTKLANGMKFYLKAGWVTSGDAFATVKEVTLSDNKKITSLFLPKQRYYFLLTVTRFFTVKDDKNILFCQTFLLPVM